MWKLDELHLGLSSYSRHAALHHVSPQRRVTTACNGMARPHVAIVGAGAAGLAAGHETLNRDDESFFKVSWDRNRFFDIFCWLILFYTTWHNLTNSCLGASAIFNVCQDDKDSNSFRQDSDVVEFLYFYRLPALGGRFSIKQEMSQHINHCTLREVINTYWVHWIISGDMSEILSKNLWTHHLPLSLHRVDWW